MADGPKWELFVGRKAERTLRRLPRDVRQRLRAAIDSLAVDPRPLGCLKLVSSETLYRIRVGDWRIIYAIEDDRLAILIVNVTPRGGAYRNL